MKAKFLGVEVEYNPAIFGINRLKRKSNQRCELCECYVASRCNWGFKLKREPDDWCDSFATKRRL